MEECAIQSRIPMPPLPIFFCIFSFILVEILGKHGNYYMKLFLTDITGKSCLRM
jgi:hypothetical protein